MRYLISIAVALVIPAFSMTAAAPSAGEYLDLSVRKIFSNRYEASQGTDVRLTIRVRFAGLPRDIREYEATGDIFGQELTFSNPLIIKKDIFGSRHILTIEGAGANIRLETRGDRQWMDVDADLGENLTPKMATVLLGIAYMLPGPKDQDPFRFASAEKDSPNGKTRLSYNFRKIGLRGFYVNGRDIDLNAWGNDMGMRTKYDMTGTAFGKELGFGDLIVETDKTFLGPLGFRVRSSEGMDLEVRRDDQYMGMTWIRGYTGTSAGMTTFLFSLAQYIFSR